MDSRELHITADRSINFAEVNLTEWLRTTGYLPADTELKRQGHETVRALIADLGVQLHYVLPAGGDKLLTFKALEDALMRANRALAVGGGPDPERVTLGSLRAMAEHRLGDAARPADPGAQWPADAKTADEAERHRIYDDARRSGLSNTEASEEAWPADGGAPWSHRPGYRLAEVAPEVTPAAESGTIPDVAPDTEEPFTLELPVDDDRSVAVTQGVGFVGIIVSGIDGTGRATLRSLDQVNIVLETIAAAAGRAFGVAG